MRAGGKAEVFAIWKIRTVGVGLNLTTLFVMVVALNSHAWAQTLFPSKESAYRQGFSAYKSRQYEIAVPALKFAAERKVLRAKYYLAKIYSDNSGGHTNHKLAYRLLSEIVEGHANVDPKDYRVAPIVAMSLTSIARYERQGIKGLLPANTQRAIVFFKHAADYFSDKDAQFELAQHYLSGDGVEARVPYALHWLAQLSKRGHAGAQAFLAKLYWDGHYTVRDPVRALALITVAVENAREEDRFWIEDVHQNIFCEANTKTRRRVFEVVEGWRKQFGRTETLVSSSDLDGLGGKTQRTCANNDVVGVLMVRPKPVPPKTGTLEASTVPLTGTLSRQPRSNGGQAQGSITPSLRPAGERPEIMMSRTRPARTDLKRFNGFMDVRSRIGRENSLSPSGQSVIERAQTRRSTDSKAHLNGFAPQRGSLSSFGFAPTGGNGR